MTAPCLELDAFVDGELDGAAASAFRVHLAGCDRCQVALEGRLAELIIAEADETAAAAGIEAGDDAGVQARRPAGAPIAAVPVAARRRWPVYAAPIAAAAAVLGIWLVGVGGGERARPVELALGLDRAGAAARGGGARVGDVAHLVARGDGHRALWVYRGDHERVAVCPGDPRCSEVAGELRLDLALGVAGPYTVVALVAAQPIAAPTGALDVMLSAATAGGAQIRLTHVDVN